MERKDRHAANLKRVVREVRIAHAEKSDVVVELRDAEQARLELLAEALEGVSEALPPDHDQLLLGLLPGQPPRFWVDATSYVIMGRDKRQYQFVKDTRLGRTVLAESAAIDTVADAITRYIAERIVERERGVEADWLTGVREVSRDRNGATRLRSDNQALIWALCGFGLGMIAGMFLLVAYAWFSTA
jgi:hypothetical protein